MKTKLEEIVADKCRDMGLSRAALDGLIGVLGKGIGEESGEEEVQRTAAEIAEVAKTMQGEATRWANKTRRDAGRDAERDGRAEPAEAEKPEGRGTDVSEAVAAAVAAAVGPLREELAMLRGAAITRTRREAVERRLEGAGEAVRAMVLEGFEHRTFADEAEFDRYVEETAEAVARIKEEMGTAALRNHSAPWAGRRSEEGVSSGVEEWLRAKSGEGQPANLEGKTI